MDSCGLDKLLWLANFRSRPSHKHSAVTKIPFWSNVVTGLANPYLLASIPDGDIIPMELVGSIPLEISGSFFLLFNDQRYCIAHIDKSCSASSFEEYSKSSWCKSARYITAAQLRTDVSLALCWSRPNWGPWSPAKSWCIVYEHAYRHRICRYPSMQGLVYGTIRLGT